MLRRLILLFVFMVPLQGALAVQPDEVLPDPALEARARAISKDLRCLVCQSESIDESQAPLARDLRLIVRERIKAGDSDEAVITYIVARYGDYVRMKPPFEPKTLVLWLGPLFVLCLGGLIIWVSLRRRTGDAVAPLSLEEERALQAALQRIDGTDRS